MSMHWSLHNQGHVRSTLPSKGTFGLSSEFWKSICIVDSLLTFVVQIMRQPIPIMLLLQNICIKLISKKLILYILHL